MKQDEIDNLITIPKIITSSPKGKFKLINRSKRINLEAVSEDQKYSFEIFIRQNDKFEERFTVGLKYIPLEDEDIILARYNGDQKGHINKYTNGAVFQSFHKHYTNEQAIEKGLKPEHHAVEANYVHFKGALLKFFEELNFTNYREYLKVFEIENIDTNQTNLFEKQ